MKSDLEIMLEALDGVSGQNWLNIGTITEGFQSLSMEIRRLVAERDDEVDAGR